MTTPHKLCLENSLILSSLKQHMKIKNHHLSSDIIFLSETIQSNVTIRSVLTDCFQQLLLLLGKISTKAYY